MTEACISATKLPMPVGWSVLRIKDLVNLKSGDFLAADQINTSGAYPVLGGNGLRGYTDRFTHDGQFVLIGRQGALCGNVNYSFGKFWATEHAIVAIPKKTFALRWFGEAIRSMNLNQLATASAQPGLSIENISSLLIAVPPIVEQRRLADWLDLQTTRIDKRRALLAKKRELLHELHKSLVHEKVCQGANQSGEMVRIKEVAKINPPTRLPRFGSVEFYPMDAIGVDGGLTAGQFKDVSAATGYSQFKNGDVLFAKVTPCFENGKSAIAQGLTTQAALATTEVIVLRSNKKISPQFLHYRLKARDFADMGESEMKGAGGLKRVPEKHVANFCFVLPSKNEQQAIVDFLDRKKSQINRQITLIDQLDDLLQQQRKALIHEAVTGKIDLSH